MPVSAALEDVAGRQHRAAEIGEDDDAAAAVGAPHRRADSVLVGAELPAWVAPRCDDVHVGPGHLTGELGEALREGGAMRDEHDSDRLEVPPPPCEVVYITEGRFDNAE